MERRPASGLIPSPVDYDRKAHSSLPIDMIFQGMSMRLFQAKQQRSRMPAPRRENGICCDLFMRR